MKSEKFSIFSNRTFRNILILFVLPSLILSVSFIITYTLNFYNNKSQTEQNCSSSLKLYSQVCETEILSVLRSCSSLYHSQPLMDFLQNKTDMSVSGTQYSVMSTISQFKGSSEIIDDIFIIDKTAGQIITPDGLFRFDSFFNDIYVYDNFSYDYWKQFTFFGREQYQILSPSAVRYSDTETAVIPIVFHSFAGVRFSKFMVVNISLDALLNSNSAYRMTDNTSIFILSRYTGDVFGINGKYGLDNILDTPLYNNMLSKVPSFDFTLSGEKVLIVSHSFSDNLLGYTYFAAVPYSDIYGMQSFLLICTIVIYIIFLIIAVYLSLANAQKVINPILHIASTLNSPKGEDTNIFEHINRSIQSLQQQKEDIAKTLPFAQEKYLINFLNSADLYIDEATRDIIKTSLPFKNDYFASVIFQIFPKQEFFDSFSLNEYDSIFSELYNIIKSMFSERFDVFFLSSERETLYITINTDESFSSEAVTDLLDEIYNIIQYDNNYLNVYTGVGSFHHGLNGLKISHKEAMDTLKSVPFDIPRIIFPGSINNSYLLSDTDESKLYNALISLDISPAQSLINNTLHKISDTQISKHLHTQILNIIFRVMQTKNLMSHELFDEYISVLGKSNDDIYRYILVLLSKLESYKVTADTSRGAYEVIEYMKNNFRDITLSLDHLADLFNVNSNYLSQIIKKHLGIGFHEYLSNLRISYARNLLLNTDKSIQEIYEESGFCSKQTFFRIFKNTVGMTPNEYRKANNNQ